ncbi:T6SS immunity protein Tli4 family protein [Geobacter sulfurreducens]|uniref:T6SS immunity protein Tli4 family protein n=1 Tax=Geobacter sulfurreducens TaxID=35554 RepID=UPI002C662698|nr:T6SS immunity protein Tli4 family protein [Geobacter sulfurreducens]HML76985.1 T6SS immunity protein Tli4 family protein [Geobacter sulfurreducens]
MTISATLRRALLFLLITPIVTLLACTSSEGTQKKSTPPSTGKGVPRMTTYPIGRFAIDVPAEMKLVHQWQRLRYAEIEEFAWSGSVPRERARDEAWKKRLTEIGKLTPPKGKERVIIETRDFPGVGAWARGILFYGNRMSPKDGNWLILMDVGQTAAWLELKGLVQYEQDMLHDLTEIAKSYQARRFGDLKLPPGNWFYTEHGVINLPYLEQETAAARFEGHPLGLEIDIETTEIHKEEAENHGLIGRTTAVIVTGYATGIDIKRIRSRTRVVTGLKGDEEVDRMDDGTRSVLSFAWRFAGRKDSGEHPKILITMECADGHLEEKLQIWDAVLNSLKPMYGTGR